ncbi:MAG: ThuA domain-containing protein [Verrucomicrobiaceae bacterium]|nr:ThuA domain-containing protein [Verrucomicrobiaceae bacterium]
MFRRTTLAILAAVVTCNPHLRSEQTAEQRNIPLEADTKDGTKVKIVLLAGSPSNKPGQHEYFAGCALMMEWLKAVPGVWPVLVADGWPRNEAILDGAKCVVSYMDGGAKMAFLDPARWARMKKLAAAGTGLVVLHQGVDCPDENAAEFRQWFGAVFQKDIGCRGHWDVKFDAIPDHPVNTGISPFDLTKDGWLYNLHFAPAGVTPLLAAMMPDKSRTTGDAKSHTGRAETVAWSYERPGGGRSFGFTGCDLHKNWDVDAQRKLVLHGILWAAGMSVPAGGVKSACTADDLMRNLDRKIFQQQQAR